MPKAKVASALNLQDPTETESANSLHRKVEVQSPLDLTYLRALGTKAAQTRLNTAFPSTEESDELHARVDALVNEFLERTYSGVRANVTVHGVDLGSGESQSGMAKEEDEFEPLNMEIAEKIREMEQKKERLLLKVARHRRIGPDAAASRWRDEWESQVQSSEQEMEQDGDIKMESSTDSAPQNFNLDLGEMKRWHEVQRSYGRGAQALAELKVGMAGMIGRLEEAKSVSEELEG